MGSCGIFFAAPRARLKSSRFRPPPCPRGRGLWPGCPRPRASATDFNSIEKLLSTRLLAREWYVAALLLPSRPGRPKLRHCMHLRPGAGHRAQDPPAARVPPEPRGSCARGTSQRSHERVSCAPYAPSSTRSCAPAPGGSLISRKRSFCPSATRALALSDGTTATRTSARPIVFAELRDPCGRTRSSRYPYRITARMAGARPIWCANGGPRAPLRSPFQPPIVRLRRLHPVNERRRAPSTRTPRHASDTTEPRWTACDLKRSFHEWSDQERREMERDDGR